MENAINKLARFKPHVAARGLCQKYLRRNYTEEKPNTVEKEKHIHPYYNIHHWNSLEEFSKCLVESVIYNRGGVVAINKPYGISTRTIHTETSEKNFKHKLWTPIINEKPYSLQDALPYVAEMLNYKHLEIVKAPEMGVSGITVLATDMGVASKLQKSYQRASRNTIIPRAHWIVTTRVPKEHKGRKRIAIKLEFSPCNTKFEPVIDKVCSTYNEQANRVLFSNMEYKVISTSPGNLSSLIEIRASARNRNSLRLFAATELCSPILGDNYIALRVQKVGDTWTTVDPFTPVNDPMPWIDPEMLKLLHLTKAEQEVIPCHIHSREIFFPCFPSRHEDLRLTAPLPPSFYWTCKQLRFKLPGEQSDIQDTTEDVTYVKDEQAVLPG